VRGSRLALALGLTLLVIAGAATGASGSTPIPIWQRLLLAGEYPGYAPQSNEPRIGSLAVSAKAMHDFFDQLKLPAITAEFRKDGVLRGISEDLNWTDQSRGGQAFVIQSSSNAGAARVQRYFQHASLLPCAHTCTVSAYIVKVPGIPGALGAKRISTKPEGQDPGQHAFEIDFVYFANGPFTYGIFSVGPPNSVDRGQLFAATKRWYQRVKDSPPVTA
jgi:hypothetical protein